MEHGAAAGGGLGREGREGGSRLPHSFQKHYSLFTPLTPPPPPFKTPLCTQAAESAAGSAFQLVLRRRLKVTGGGVGLGLLCTGGLIYS